EAGESNLFGVTSADELEFVVPDEVVTAVVDGGEWLPRKIAAMRAHASQISADGPFFTLIDTIGEGAFGLALVEAFLVPLRVGTVPLPICVLLGVAGNVVLTKLAVRQTGSVVVGVLQPVLWLLVVVV